MPAYHKEDIRVSITCDVVECPWHPEASDLNFPKAYRMAMEHYKHTRHGVRVIEVSDTLMDDEYWLKESRMENGMRFGQAKRSRT